MGCATLYDWMRQSPEHEKAARQLYPTSYNMAAVSPNYGAFIAMTHRLPASGRRAYNAEFNAWWRDYGYTWDRMGCMGERSVGDLARQFSFPNQEHHMSTRPRTLRGVMVSGFKPFGRSRRTEVTRPPSQKRPPPRVRFDVRRFPFFRGLRGAFGQTTTKPALEPGYTWCSSIPPGMPITDMRPVPGDTNGWYYRIWAGSDDDKNYYEYKQYSSWDWAASGSGDTLYACPLKTGYTGSTASLTEVKSIQSALANMGYNPGKIDGKWGPTTCGAAFSFKKNELGEYGATLGPSFFAALGLGGNGYDQKYAQACASWFTGDLGPEPDSVPNAPVKEVQKALLNAGYSPGTIDGKWGANTCKAAYAFMREQLGDYGEVLTGQFYTALGLPGSGYNTSCKAYYVQMTPPAPPPTPLTPLPEEPPTTPPPTPVTPTPPSPTPPKPQPPKPQPPAPKPPAPQPPAPKPPIPEPAKAGFPWWIGAVVVGGLIVGGATIGKKKKGKKRRKGKKRGKRRR